MVFKSKAQARKETGLNYLGSVNMTTKHVKAYQYNELVYGLYLAPAKLSGYEVCPMRSNECTELCLNGSGMSVIHEDHVNYSRIKKTKLFFEHREFFMDWLIAEIETVRKKAEKLGYRFSIRLNNTSDISPESFYINKDGKSVNILQLYPNVQFYDYTKVPKRIELTQKYPNYDITFSYSGFNMDTCIKMLSNGIRVAMVFKNVPETFMGFKVIDGDEYDMRYLDQNNVIVGLKYKKLKAEKNKLLQTFKFVIQ
jgi:hypothetical protein